MNHNPLQKKILLCAVSAIASIATASGANNSTFNGTVSGEPTNNANWSGTTPNISYDATITPAGSYAIDANGANAFTWDDTTNGTTTFNSPLVQFLVEGGTMNLQAGTISVTTGTSATNGGTIVGQSGNASTISVFNISGGTFASAVTGGAGKGGFFIGNNAGTSTVNMTGGTLDVTASFAGTVDSFFIGRGTGAGVFNLSGSSMVELTASTAVDAFFTFGSSASDLIDFSATSAWTGSLSLSNNGVAGSTENTFLTTDLSHLEVNGTAATANDFTVNSTLNPGYDVYQLAAPEPATYALMLLGGAALFVVVRRRGHFQS